MAGINQFSRATSALESSGVAEATQSATKEMRGKHPQREEPYEEKETQGEALKTNMEGVALALRRFRKGTAPGLDGMRLEHILSCMGNLTLRKEGGLLGGLTALVNTLLRGEVPDSIAPYFSEHSSMRQKRRMEA